MARWNPIRPTMGMPPAPAPDVDTGALIEAVLRGQPTEGGPGHLAGHVPGRRDGAAGGTAGAGDPVRPPASAGLGAKISAAAATVAGKIVLCTAVAAASVGGVFATDAVDRPWDSQPTQTTPSTSTAAAPTTTTTTTVSAETTTAPAPATDAAPEDEVAEVVAEGLTGCEYGQATAAAASQNASADRQNPDRDHDPCSASETAPGHTVAEADEEPSSPPGNGQGNRNPQAEPDGGPGRSNPPGRGGKG